MGEKVHTGSVVHILYKGGAKGEKMLDDRSEGEPLRVMIGDMKLPRGIEEALVGMEVGQEKQLEIPPELGYPPPATITCFQCGGEVDPATGTCSACGYVAFQPAGAGKAHNSSQERSPQRGSEVRTHDHTA